MVDLLVKFPLLNSVILLFGPTWFTSAATASEPLMIAQVQVVNVPNIELAQAKIIAASQELVELADKVCGNFSRPLNRLRGSTFSKDSRKGM